jgi:hypothetical protein
VIQGPSGSTEALEYNLSLAWREMADRCVYVHVCIQRENLSLYTLCIHTLYRENVCIQRENLSLAWREMADRCTRAHARA